MDRQETTGQRTLVRQHYSTTFHSYNELFLQVQKLPTQHMYVATVYSLTVSGAKKVK